MSRLHVRPTGLLAFVRRAHELDAMRDLSIEGGQGFLLGRPQTAAEPAHTLAA